MDPQNLANLEYLTEREIIEAYEKLYGPLPPAKQCAWCGAWYVITEAGRRASPNNKYCSRKHATAASQAAFQERQKHHR